jgi:hypothetical protein
MRFLYACTGVIGGVISIAATYLIFVFAMFIGGDGGSEPDCGLLERAKRHRECCFSPARTNGYLGRFSSGCLVTLRMRTAVCLTP